MPPTEIPAGASVRTERRVNKNNTQLQKNATEKRPSGHIVGIPQTKDQ